MGMKIIAFSQSKISKTAGNLNRWKKSTWIECYKIEVPNVKLSFLFSAFRQYLDLTYDEKNNNLINEFFINQVPQPFFDYTCSTFSWKPSFQLLWMLSADPTKYSSFIT